MMKALNFSSASQTYFKDIMENPSMENVLKTVINLQMDDSDDEDLKEIKQLLN